MAEDATTSGRSDRLVADELAAEEFAADRPVADKFAPAWFAADGLAADAFPPDGFAMTRQPTNTSSDQQVQTLLMATILGVGPNHG